ncbi:hypothetical protein DFP78_11297 [Photobacterium lutimaris]|nr:hypothetical protein DFP78_11297 [Photobacterium lutimaris]
MTYRLNDTVLVCNDNEQDFLSKYKKSRSGGCGS